MEDWFADPRFGKLLTLSVVLLVLHVLLWLGRRTLMESIRNSETRYRFRKAFNVLGFLLSVIVVTWFFGDRFGNLSVAFGVAGAGVAFALQEVIASCAGWVAISIGGFYSIGDRVQLGGIVGDVIDIGVLRTTLMETGEWVKGDLYSGRIVLIANSFVFKEPVFNYSGDFPFLWDEITVPVKYGSDHRLARELLQQAAREVAGEFVPKATEVWKEMQLKYRLEAARIDPVVTLVANDNWLEYTVRYVVDFKLRRSTKDRLFERILDKLETSGGKVWLASSTLHLVEAPTLNVRIAPTETERTV